MKTVNIHEAKSQLSKLLVQVEAGEDVIIARNGTPVARLVPASKARPKREFGVLKGKIKFDETFFDALPPEELEGWE